MLDVVTSLLKNSFLFLSSMLVGETGNN
ncbi:hypothetical protein Ahy_B04g070045 isoform E [Arachis hypogaea]|uniref:Uncharacterized protein n=1 Tax=Arachis hypogaea TaxID=3818 RepID=A0A444ZEE8_ARAHY|nr:hypothetical protein Ahy_B04g070045 isoform E [Arachis hypogaea]